MCCWGCIFQIVWPSKDQMIFFFCYVLKWKSTEFNWVSKLFHMTVYLFVDVIWFSIFVSDKIEFIILRVAKYLLGPLHTNTDTYRNRSISSAWRSESCVNVHTLFYKATLCHMSHSIPPWHSIPSKKTSISQILSFFLFYVFQD